MAYRYRKTKPDPPVSVERLARGIAIGDRAALARAITLAESDRPDHFRLAQELLQRVGDRTGNTLRIGITGVPGAGKSTFIETFGMKLCALGKKVAVLAVDPSSALSKGSIMGDKTRMANLAKHPNAFIRPSATGGHLGGVHRKTRESILLCEAAGYDVILVETVGVGQNETAVRTMVDCFLLLAITGAGDELQGMKKGLMELVDIVLVHKADGDNKEKALETKKELDRIFRFLKPATEGWQVRVLPCSSLTGEGIGDVIDLVFRFERETKKSGIFAERRRKQTKDWLYSAIADQLQNAFFRDGRIREVLPETESDVMSGKLPVSAAAEKLLAIFLESRL
jgi:LAO/AO transport system kinase